MNRSDFKERIAEGMPILQETEGTRYAAARLRQTFVRDYTAARILRLSLDDYVIGKGKANRSFCYVMPSLGSGYAD